MQPRFVPALTVVTLLAGCAVLRQWTEAGDGQALSSDLAAARGDRSAVQARLEGLYASGLSDLSDDDRGEATLALAALDLDPRNRTGRPARAVARLARLLQSERLADAPARLVAETLYLLALETGAPADAGVGDPSSLPRLRRPSLAARLFRAETRRDSLRRETYELRARLMARTRRLARAERELARIRELLKR